MIEHVRRRYSCCCCYLLLVAVLNEGVLSSLTEKNDNEDTTVENLPIVSKRQINFQSSNFNQQQVPQDYTEFYQQTNAASNQKSQLEQQTGPQEFLPGSQPDAYPPTRRTPLSPFAAEQVRLQTEYKNRAVAAQLTSQQQRSRPRTFVQPSLQFQAQQQQQRLPPQYPNENNRAVEQSVAPQQQDEVGPDPQRDVAPGQIDEPYSYAEVQFGPDAEPTEPALVERPKGQRSVARPRTSYPALEPAVQQTIQNPTTIFPVQFNPRLLQNVVYIQPNGQIHRPVEDAEPVVEIPRRNKYRLYGHSSASVSGPETAASGASPIPVTTASANPAEDEPVVLIPRPKKPENPPGRIRQEGRKPGRAQQTVKTTRPPPPSPPLQQQAEVEPDNFLTSLLYRLQQQQQPDADAELGTTIAPKPRGGQRSKGGDRSDASKYLPDRSQLQLLQFPNELQSLSSAELRALESAGAQIAAADEKFVGQKRLPKSRPVAVSGVAQTPLTLAQPERPIADELFDGERNVRPSSGHRPVPTPVELNNEQRQFLAAQGIRNLYRVDYDQAGNALPLTYVLALDNRAKRAERRLSAAITSPPEES